MTSVCAEAGCPNPAVYRGRCARHQQRTRTGSRPWRRRVAQVIARDRGICWRCGGLGADSADHVIRARDGGSDEVSNLRAAHIDCNRRRG